MKKRLLLALACLCALALSAMAENYPYRSDVLWVTVPDHADWLYQTGEKARVEVQLYKYGIPQDGLTVTYEIGGDMMPADASGSVTLKNGRATIDVGTMREPGFRDLRLTAKLGDRTYRHHVKVGFSPEKLQPYTQMPQDFKAFWDQAKAELAKFPLKYTKELAPEYCTDQVVCYLIKLQVNKSGQAVYGYLFYPKDAQPGRHPVVLCPPGAGVKTLKEPLRHKYYSEQGCIRLEMEIHGIHPKTPTETFNEFNKAFENGGLGYLTRGLDDRDHYYMRHVYLACVRCIDLLTSLPEWDGRNVAVQGGSQGGALALITAGLDERVTACVANHPALSDMAGYKANRAGGYPHFPKMHNMYTAEKLQNMAYYDVVNFARLITAPTRITWGYNDDTCPPTTSYIVYNLLTCPKEALITPINEHWTSEVTEEDHLAWILAHLK